MAREHHEEHRKQARFNARHVISYSGMNCGERCAEYVALGLIEGSIDELVTMLGEEKAYEAIMALADRVIKKTTAG